MEKVLGTMKTSNIFIIYVIKTQVQKNLDFHPDFVAGLTLVSPTGVTVRL